MTAEQGLIDAILLRHADRLVELERRTATNASAIEGLHDNVGLLRTATTDLARDLGELRSASTTASHSFEEMQKPLQGLLDLRQRFSGGWLVATAILMVAAYLFQPLLAELYQLRFGIR